jgi:hypothetical protein
MSGPGTERVSERVANVEGGDNEQSGAKTTNFFVRLEVLINSRCNSLKTIFAANFVLWKPT